MTNRPDTRRHADDVQGAFTLRNWRSLVAASKDELDPVHAALESLAVWVDWLVGRYHLAHAIPPCWWAHGPLVEELSALETAWHGSYEKANAPADAGIAWHEVLRRSIARLREWNVERCATGHHRPVDNDGWTTDMSWPPDPRAPADSQTTKIECAKEPTDPAERET